MNMKQSQLPPTTDYKPLLNMIFKDLLFEFEVYFDFLDYVPFNWKFLLCRTKALCSPTEFHKQTYRKVNNRIKRTFLKNAKEMGLEVDPERVTCRAEEVQHYILSVKMTPLLIKQTIRLYKLYGEN